MNLDTQLGWAFYMFAFVFMLIGIDTQSTHQFLTGVGLLGVAFIMLREGSKLND